MAVIDGERVLKFLTTELAAEEKAEEKADTSTEQSAPRV